MSALVNSSAAPSTKGRVLHAPRFYDALAWVFLLGREREFRGRLLTLAQIKPGERVLDIGCGTGTLAIAAKRQTGDAGPVTGLDASPEMVSRASRKARRAGLDVAFRQGVVEELPFADSQFDVVLSSLMLHHLPTQARRRCLAEARRVLAPKGRVFIADFGEPTRRDSFWGRIHRHGAVRPGEIVSMLREAGFQTSGLEPVGMGGVHYAIGIAR